MFVTVPPNRGSKFSISRGVTVSAWWAHVTRIGHRSRDRKIDYFPGLTSDHGQRQPRWQQEDSPVVPSPVQTPEDKRPRPELATWAVPDNNHTHTHTLTGLDIGQDHVGRRRVPGKKAHRTPTIKLRWNGSWTWYEPVRGYLQPFRARQKKGTRGGGNCSGTMNKN